MHTQVKDLAEVPAAQASPLECNARRLDKVTPVAHRSSQRQECKVQPLLRMRFHWHVIHYEQAIKIRIERELSGTEMNQQVNEGGTHKEYAIRTHTSTEGPKAVESPPILLFPQRHVGGSGTLVECRLSGDTSSLNGAARFNSEAKSEQNYPGKWQERGQIRQKGIPTPGEHARTRYVPRGESVTEAWGSGYCSHFLENIDVFKLKSPPLKGPTVIMTL
ncbi:hypothetical protein EDB84DRAFT_1440372 [Lactarius hengduanensis]|nr:hypothetical protein EDB84DRAFT_1440372 [Lactarius hengduanensis]